MRSQRAALLRRRRWKPSSPLRCSRHLRVHSSLLLVRLDVTNAPYLREPLVEAVRESPPEVLVDLSKVGFLDSSAIGLLVSFDDVSQTSAVTFSVRCRGRQPGPGIGAAGPALTPQRRFRRDSCLPARLRTHPFG